MDNKDTLGKGFHESEWLPNWQGGGSCLCCQIPPKQTAKRWSVSKAFQGKGCSSPKSKAFHSQCVQRGGGSAIGRCWATLLQQCFLMGCWASVLVIARIALRVPGVHMLCWTMTPRWDPPLQRQQTEHLKGGRDHAFGPCMPSRSAGNSIIKGENHTCLKVPICRYLKRQANSKLRAWNENERRKRESRKWEKKAASAWQQIR